MTQNNHLFISDFASYKPFFLQDDNLGDWRYFFFIEDDKSCNLAPERFINKTSPNRKYLKYICDFSSEKPNIINVKDQM